MFDELAMIELVNMMMLIDDDEYVISKMIKWILNMIMMINDESDND